MSKRKMHLAIDTDRFGPWEPLCDATGDVLMSASEPPTCAECKQLLAENNKRWAERARG